ncbi:ABC transporter substrate-binding protein [Azospirillum sp. SYSU D00513]|uniref:ABC transporter substrate-binding protein n=1 Tax=Azospirillum sp. SYSU D00513 TaxID=2812561 RepID=UPI001FFF480C|nr:ABC transporter substrate-binding protein [Azospirillum sp. SYSU D00513]
MRKMIAPALLAALLCGTALMPVTAGAAEVKNGGTMVVTYKDDLATLDPAIGYDWQNFSIIKAMFSGLMAYEPGSTKLRPNLAESYEQTADGLAYTFKLRQGVKFHNGRELTAEDVKYSIQRAVNPATQSPGQSFFSMIKGYEEAAKGDGTLSGITVVDPHTVRIELSRPDATFLHVMAINFSYAVPKEEVEKHGADFGRHPVGTGAFKMAEWTLGQRLVLERNPDYFEKGLPHLDQISFEIGQDPSVALLRLQRGEVDVLGDGIPPAKYLEVRNDAKNKDLVLEGNQLQTGYITMNTRMKPFDDVRVRQAVNMAVNKDRVVRIINGRAAPANQPLPPAMPGYAKDYKGYGFDQAKAKELLKAAGYPNGFETEILATNTDPNPRIVQAIQQDLSAVGIKAQVKTLAQANVVAAGGEEKGAAMIWSGGMAWIADFPDPSNFYGPILGCGSAVQGGWNWAWYCNKDLDALADKANAMVDPAKEQERIATWSTVFTKVMEDAPWVPVFNEKRIIMRSPRMAGPDAIFVDPVHYPVNYSHVYAKDVQ